MLCWFVQPHKSSTEEPWFPTVPVFAYHLIYVFYAVIFISHQQSFSGEEVRSSTLDNYFTYHFQLKGILFIHDCLDCLTEKNLIVRKQTVPTQISAETSACFNFRTSIHTKGPLSPLPITFMLLLMPLPVSLLLLFPLLMMMAKLPR